VWDSAAFSSIFLASSFSCSQAESTPAHTQVTQTVGPLIYQSYEAISELMIGKVFRQLENERSTKDLLDKILTKTVSIDETIKTNALKYLDMRHLFVHAAGIIDQPFIDKYGKDISLKVGDKLPTTYENARAAIEAVDLLCRTVDQQLINKGFVQQIKTPVLPKTAG
jgi:hypothetical protein